MLRTNFKNSDLPIYEKAILEYKEKTRIDRLFISYGAYDRLGRFLHDSNALHDKMSSDLTGFWIIFNRIKEESN